MLYEYYFRFESWLKSIRVPVSGRTIGDVMQDSEQIAIWRTLTVVVIMLGVALVLQRWENARNDPRYKYRKDQQP